MLSDTTSVFKLVGPVLMKVELQEAKENVRKRIEFIEGEIVKIDNQIGEKQGAQTTIGEEVLIKFIFSFQPLIMIYICR
jgi:prefoldin beta subunit